MTELKGCTEGVFTMPRVSSSQPNGHGPCIRNLAGARTPCPSYEWPILSTVLTVVHVGV